MSKTGGQAFPSLERLDVDQARWEGFKAQSAGGMTLRDWFAGQALAYPIGKPGMSAETRARDAYELADAMLAERAR